MNWNNVRTIQNSQNNGFEELVVKDSGKRGRFDCKK